VPPRPQMCCTPFRRLAKAVCAAFSLPCLMWLSSAYGWSAVPQGCRSAVPQGCTSAWRGVALLCHRGAAVLGGVWHYCATGVQQCLARLIACVHACNLPGPLCPPETVKLQRCLLMPLFCFHVFRTLQICTEKACERCRGQGA